MEADSIETETADALLKFAQNGGKIIFIKQAPSRSPGWIDAQKNDASVRKTMAEILEKHADCCRVAAAPAEDLIQWFAEIQKSFNLKPDVRFAAACVDISQIYLRDGQRDIFFIVNSNPQKQYETLAQFDVGDKTPWVWDPETGRRFLLPCGQTNKQLPLTLPPAASMLLVFEPGRVASPPAMKDPTQAQTVQVIEGPWQVMLSHVNHTQTRVTLPKLVDFKEDKQLSSFAGEIMYSVEFQAADAKQFVSLDLGRVHGISSVKLNGCLLGTRWYGRHLYEIKNNMKIGGNTLEISVITTLGNYCKSLVSNPVAQQWTKNQPLRSVGMVGPVRLLDNP